MSRTKDISDDLREATVAAHQSGKGYETISKQTIIGGKHLRQLPVFPGAGIPASSAQGQVVPCSEKLEKNISYSTGLT